eukprot:EG_transcript_6930
MLPRLLLCLAAVGLWQFGASAGSTCEMATNLVTLPTLSTNYTGDGTYYGATGAGACSYDASPTDLMVAALNAPQWATAGWCGACARVTGPKGTITVRIVDLCPECHAGDLDLSLEAFVLIADQVQGRVRISWQFVACSTVGPLSYRFKDGSSQWWMGVQVLNSPLPVGNLELLQGASYVPLVPQAYNYYTTSSAPGAGPFTFRVTTRDGQQLLQPGVALAPTAVVPGNKTFAVPLSPTGTVRVLLSATSLTVTYSTASEWCLKTVDVWMGIGTLPSKANHSSFPVHASGPSGCSHSLSIDYPLSAVGAGFQCTQAVVKVIAYADLQPAGGSGLVPAVGNGTGRVLPTYWWPYFNFNCSHCVSGTAANPASQRTPSATPTSTTTSTLTQTATVTATASSVDPCLRALSGPNCQPVSLAIQTGHFGADQAWALYSATPGCRTPLAATLPQTLLSLRRYTTALCLRPGPYRLVLLDAYGDGWNGGAYLVTRNGTVLVPQRSVNGTGAVELFTVAP